MSEYEPTDNEIQHAMESEGDRLAFAQQETRPVPRVASSLDDLRVGQVVVLDRGMGRKIGTVRSVGNGGAMLQLDGDDLRSQSAFAFDIGSWVILSDPPPSPVTVSRTAYDELKRMATDDLAYSAQQWLLAVTALIGADPND